MNDYDQNFAFCEYGSKDLLKLDLSPFNVKFIEVEADDFVDVMKVFFGVTSTAISSEDYENTSLNKLLDHDPPVLGYVLYPIDRDVKVPALTLFHIIDCLSILFPSEFRMEWCYSLNRHGTIFRDAMKYGRHSHTPYYSRLLEDKGFDMFELPSIDLSDLNTAVQRRCKMKIEGFHFDLLLHSFNECGILPTTTMAYVSLCIGLESLVTGQSEINHKIARTCAVLNADSREEGRIIFNKTKKAYEIRSLIVHGEKSIGDLRESFQYLLAVVSTTFNALVELGIKDLKTLNDLVAESGFGDRLIGRERVFEINPELRSIVVSPPKPKAENQSKRGKDKVPNQNK